MSWLDNVFGWIPRLFGWGTPKDINIPKPLPGVDRIQLLQEPGSNTPTVQRESEAIAAIRGFVREPYQITDRKIRVMALTWEDGKTSFVSRGNDPKKWSKNRIGMFYAPKGGTEYGANDGLIHLVMAKMDQPERVRLALHEYGHAAWHWLLTAQEWDGWQSRNWSYEEFADRGTCRLS